MQESVFLRLTHSQVPSSEAAFKGTVDPRAQLQLQGSRAVAENQTISSPGRAAPVQDAAGGKSYHVLAKERSEGGLQTVSLQTE